MTQTHKINAQSRGPIWAGKQCAPEALFFAPADRLPNTANTCLAECVVNDWDTANPLISRGTMLANARLLAAGFTMLDKAGLALGVDAAELGESIDLAALIGAAREALTYLDSLPNAPKGSIAEVGQCGVRLLLRAQLAKLPKPAQS